MADVLSQLELLIMEWLAQSGYTGMFLSAFLAATLLPLGSEVVLTVLLINHFDPGITIAVATAGNTLGSLVNYAAGFWGSLFLINRILKIKEAESVPALNRLKKYGAASLLFAWLPIIGDPLTFAAGILKINLVLFLILVTAGKFIRYLVIGYAVL
ncbi:MAG: YqaA family protein [Pseudomonadota bacterium]